MAIHGQCPGCGRSFQAPDKLAGKRVKCPNCSAAILVGTPPQQSEASADQSPRPPEPRRPPNAEHRQWYVETADGGQLGPMDKAALDALVAEGGLDRSCRLRREDWQQGKEAEVVYPRLAPPVVSGSQGKARQEEAPEAADVIVAETTGTDADGETDADAEPRLRPCPDCKEMVSRRAGQCPHCGCPLGAAAVGRQTAASRAAAAASLSPSPTGRRKAGLLVAAAICAVLLVFLAVGIGAWWLFGGILRDQQATLESIGQLTDLPSMSPIEPPEPPPEGPTPEQIEQYMQDSAGAAAKGVDQAYRESHLLRSSVQTLGQIADLYGSVIDNPMGDPGEQLTPPAAAEPYQSQYEPLYEQCMAYLRENFSAEEDDPSRIAELAELWTNEKLATLQQQLLEQQVPGPLGF